MDAHIFEALSAKLDPKHVKQRSQSGRSLSYIEGWHAIAEANRIFNFDGWTRETVDIRCVVEKPRKVGSAGREGWGVTYIAKVRVVALGVTREGTGTGHGIDADLGAAHESAIKEAETDAMKRALMTFGNPFGLALYDKTQANVGVDAVPDGDTYAPPGEPVPAGEPLSAHAMKRDFPEEWPELERDVRAATNRDELTEVWNKHRERRAKWPKTWRDQADELFVTRSGEVADRSSEQLDAAE